MSDRNVEGTPVVNTQQGEPKNRPLTLNVTGSPLAEQSVRIERRFAPIPNVENENEVGEDALDDNGIRPPSKVRQSLQRSNRMSVQSEGDRPTPSESTVRRSGHLVYDTPGWNNEALSVGQDDGKVSITPEV